MDIEKFTERARGFIQSAQGLALRSGNQQFTPEHLLKVLIDDEEGLAARLIAAAGGNDRSRCATASTRALAKLPKVEGSAPARSICRPGNRAPAGRCRAGGQEGGRQLRHRRISAAGARHGGGHEAAKILKDAGVTPQGLNKAIADLRKGRTADSATAENAYDALKKYARDLTETGAHRQARSGDRPRRGNPPHHPGALAAAPRTIPC